MCSPIGGDTGQIERNRKGSTYNRRTVNTWTWSDNRVQGDRMSRSWQWPCGEFTLLTMMWPLGYLYCLQAFHKWLPLGWYTSPDRTWHTTSINKRLLQGPPCGLGRGIPQIAAWNEGSRTHSRWYWSEVCSDHFISVSAWLLTSIS